MILIISNNNEFTTTEVTKWLTLMGKPFIRIHEDEFFEIKTLENRLFLKSFRNEFFIDEICSVWYRRGGIKFKRLDYDSFAIRNHMNEVQDVLENYVLRKIESKKTINKKNSSYVNKLSVLEEAEKIGLSVPKYFLADNTNDVIINKTIIKSITGGIILESISKDLNGVMYTATVKEKEKDKFFISFFQEKIEKDFEIRIFYLNGEIWSAAIFSPTDEIDYRKSATNPPRIIRYNIPIKIKKKITLLMKSLDLNCGSIDFIKKNNTYYFLEINPVGQFSNISFICNYSLEKKIAEYL